MEQVLPPIIRTERLELCPKVDSDVEGLFAIRSREEVMKWSLKKVPDANIDVTREWIQGFTVPNPIEKIGYTVREIDSDSGEEGRVVGSLGVWLERTKTVGNPRWEMGYIFHPDFWGKGYATEAVTALVKEWSNICDSVFAERAETKELIAISARANSSSINVLTKCGFVLVGEFQDMNATECVLFRAGVV